MARNPKARPQNGLKRLEERFTEGEPVLTFAAYVRENFDRFHKLILSVGRRADKWEIVARWANEERILGDRTVKPGAARRAYERVRAEKLPKKTRGKRPSGQPALNPAPVRMLPTEGATSEPSSAQAKLENLRARMKKD